jgi:hypothetical protein
MSFPLRQLSHSRPCLALAWLAWLLLLVSPLQAAPMAMAAGVAQGGHAAMAQHGELAADADVADDCCAAQPLPAGDVAQHACHCAAWCGSALPAWALPMPDRVAMQTPRATPRSPFMPHGVYVRLLRPPAA